MLLEEIKSIKSSKSDLRKFGLSVGIVLGLLGGLLWWKGKGSYPYFVTASAILIISGLAVPSLLKPLQKIWMAFAVVMGWIMTRVILIVAFFCVITPIGFILSITGKDFLDKSLTNEQSSSLIQTSDEGGSVE